MHDRLRQARQLAGYKTATAAWRALVAAGHDIAQQTYLQHENGTRPNFEGDARTYADFFGVSVEWLMTGRGQPRSVKGLSDRQELTYSKVPTNPYGEQQSPPLEIPRIIGRVAAGVFRSVETVDKMDMRKYPVSPFPVDPRYPVEHQFDLVVEGDSVNKFAQDGDVLRCVRFPDGNISLTDGDLVIVRRIVAGGVAETTAKRYRRNALGQAELWFDSDDPDLQGRMPLGDDGDAEIIAVAIYSYRPARPLAALP